MLILQQDATCWHCERQQPGLNFIATISCTLSAKASDCQRDGGPLQAGYEKSHFLTSPI